MSSLFPECRNSGRPINAFYSKALFFLKMGFQNLHPLNYHFYSVKRFLKNTLIDTNYYLEIDAKIEN